ncbi:hypothetical protein ES319_A06G177900v1 [Gossypium barbadense]|uniref:Transport inhibitor response 1 domain-containing protein n=2 Tax=Gossypium TaxID=3633 RepID=A0A5J5VHX6_GOSBA|nr:hypothetical protein ES319_A06G177900v1 [Gossypium barbadense]TYH14195.1 hypothetical protein ES288_A06G200700v1 [Gossypium darwinii]
MNISSIFPTVMAAYKFVIHHFYSLLSISTVHFSSFYIFFFLYLVFSTRSIPDPIFSTYLRIHFFQSVSRFDLKIVPDFLLKIQFEFLDGRNRFIQCRFGLGDDVRRQPERPRCHFPRFWRWYELDAVTRKHISILLCSTTSPDRLLRRFRHLESLKLKGKPRAAMFNLIPEDWGGHVTPWVKEIVEISIA